ncbi:peptidase M20 [Virgibacillus profundi]|uniref:Peptidase M20 domain-containing protein 2 n=1 Tax=Virgibacillus profundi TaxID=2024555 RepID=A0A2A2IAG8_9BACI|nr:M20 family metallopeptidase [Virgibacillus profundi]PAV28378.1 peptidase M20 [Virgibacillus profundi]PXY52260.1 amidohydrolase [Virgibacillus profundi]
MEEIKKYYDDYLDSRLDELWDIAKYVHSNPELGYQEEKACQIQCEFLRENGFKVEENLGGLPTAYKAVYQYEPGDLTIAVVSEYDALPEIGHACGHNLICTAALGTAIETKKYMEDQKIPGTLVVMGTPAEESGGGKIKLLEKNAWDGIDAILFMHPTSDTTRLAGECMSSTSIQIEFRGKSAHAASHPANGINALSAANLYFVATGLMRQHAKSDLRLSGIIEDGGKTPSLIPNFASVKGSVSCFKSNDLEDYIERVRKCAEGAALATGCEANIEFTPGYLGRVPNETLSEVCRKELNSIDEPVMDGMPFDYGGEDLGNVSRVIPICNPYVTIFPDYKISNHTEQFRDLANSSAGKRCIQVSSKAMARTAMELFRNPKTVEDAKIELSERMKNE